ncbi:hypothetical protein PHYPSEUDO_004065 [Phytophthora pseudosyringae]|uniref:Ankyrin repeat protein n=1 Tax=Phytophthora pseudosyringae TaxID=221518 RepID=A0A8T1VPP2_9STRA|nr:hypothetical protein PHYPSEUDO_004065 [Phytophthora pseudosyringae]
MIPASPASRDALEASQHVQAGDTFLLEVERYERVYQRRKMHFQSLQQQSNVSNCQLSLLGDRKPWEVFSSGSSSGGRLQRRRLVFERSTSFPALHQACATGDRDRVPALLSTPGVCVLERDACGRVALHHAVVNENVAVAKRLLRRRDAKLQVHVRDGSSRTALHYALEKLEVLALHRREDSRIPALVTAEMRAESKRYRRLWGLADRMLDMFSKGVIEGGWAIEGGSGESIKLLDMRCRGDVWDACRSGDLERLEMIVKIYGCSRDQWELSKLKRTLLHEACEHQQLQVAYFLISTMGLPVLAQDTSGCTALHCAARRGYVDVCQVLLGKTPAKDCGQVHLHLNENVEGLELLQDVRGRTALHWCLLGSCDPFTRLQMAVVLAQSCPAALHMCDHDGVSPLHIAIWRGDLKLVQEFISLGANVCASSFRILHSIPGGDVGKASWAPCGIIFQHRRPKVSENLVPIAATPSDKAPDAISGPTQIKKYAPDWENLQHPVEALWYWTRQPSRRNLTSNGKAENDESATAEDELGCRKYGGVCSRCQLVTVNVSTKLPSSTSNDKRSQLLPRPLLLALRMCALKVADGSMLAHRVAIVELLLANGAPPDEVSGDENAGSKVKFELSALSEGLRSSLGCPQLIPALRQHGAEQVGIQHIIRWCFSVPSSDAKQVETVLLHLLDLEDVASSPELLTMLFYQKHFITVCELWSHKAHNITPEDTAAVATDRERSWFQGGPPWKCIQETLMSWNNPRKSPVGVRRIDTKHLKFLCGLVQPVENVRAEMDDVLPDRGAWELFEYCVDMFLEQRCHFHSGFTSNQSEVPIEDCEWVVLLCIQIQFKHWNRSETGDQRLTSKAAKWLEPSIVRGYFDCALVILETLHRLGGSSTLLDTVFELCSSAIGARTRFDDGPFHHHREFLIVCAENLLKVNAPGVDGDQTQMNSTAVASARSIVHMCANNLPFALVESCFETVFPDNPLEAAPDKSNVLASMKTIRVGGKTMAQWVVAHDRRDIMSWLLTRLSPGVERGLCWSEFVAASSLASLNIVETMFAVYQELVQTHLSVNERKDLLVNLMVKRAIPTDSVALFKCLLKLSESMASDCAEPGGTEHTSTFLKQAGILHSIVRWNAVRVAEFSMSGQCPSGELRMNQVDWQQLFNQETQHRHELDDCTPMELCRLLGHNHLYSLLSSRALLPSLPAVKTEEETNPAETNSPESAETSDNALCTEEESAGQWQIGLLRSILDINEDVKTKDTEQGASVDKFRGYQRHATIQDPWVSAIAQNQVSHLQAMSLTRRQGSHPDVPVRTLVLAAIKTASLNALKWVLEANSPVTKHLSAEEGVECLYAAAKHPGVVNAEMTLLLLENELNPGRLAGDGMGIPLLHRAACFVSTVLASRIMTLLLGRSDCDVNALDAFGNTAVSYAIAAGRFHNACFLIQNPTCRLEAEYEGQSSFYYALHLVPSFAWRTVVRELLVTKRARAFLHCDAESKTCGCKGYERSQEGEDGAWSPPCGFCGHEASCHRIVPLPSWFRDQYDTYIVAAAKSVRRSSSDEGDDSDGDTSRHYLTDNEHDAVGDEDEEIVLENGRGRLDVELLSQITVLRYDDILHANGLSVAVHGAYTEDAIDAQETATALADGDNCGSAWQTSSELAVSVLKVMQPNCVTMMEELLPTTSDVQPGTADQCAPFNDSATRGGSASRRKFTGAWWLRQELAMVHSRRCPCQAPAFVVRPSQLAHVAVCRWLRRMAIARVQQQHATVDGAPSSGGNVTRSAIVAVQPAFAHWRDVARLSRIEAVPPPLPRVLSSVLFHWRLGKEFAAFQRWKNHETSAEVAQHRLATRLEHVAATMRRNRFLTLQLRQQQLRASTRRLLVSSP